MTDLERRALLGDREAQEECTRQGIVLPCPFCREAKNLVVRNVCGDAFVECLRCHATSSLTSSPDTTIKDWNTRAAPPVGRCGTCKDRYTSEFCECRPYERERFTAHRRKYR